MHFLLWLDLASEPDITPENALAVAYRSILNDAADPHLKWTITHDNVSLTPWADDVVVCDMTHNLPPRINLEGISIRLPRHVWDAVNKLVGAKVSELVKAGEIKPDERGEHGEGHPLWLAERMIDGQLLAVEQERDDDDGVAPVDSFDERFAVVYELAGDTYIDNYVGRFQWMKQNEVDIVRVVGRKRSERDQPCRSVDYPAARVIRVTSEIPA